MQVTESDGHSYLLNATGTSNQLDVNVKDNDEKIKVEILELIKYPDSLFDDLTNASPLVVSPKKLPPLSIKPPKITSNDQWKYVADVFLIDERYYPREQFIKTSPNICIYDHYATKSGYAISLDLHVLPDPSPSGCRFGPTHFMTPTGEYALKAQILAWEKVTGINIEADDYE